MNFDRKVELITWLIAVVPHQYLPTSIRIMMDEMKCGSLDCVAEIVSAYIDGESFLGNEFKIMTREEILSHADKLKADPSMCECGHPKSRHIGDDECFAMDCPCQFFLPKKGSVI